MFPTVATCAVTANSRMEIIADGNVPNLAWPSNSPDSPRPIRRWPARSFRTAGRMMRRATRPILESTQRLLSGK